MFPELYLHKLGYKWNHWDWPPYKLLISAFCPVVVFCGAVHLLYRETSLMRGGSNTYLRVRVLGLEYSKELFWSNKFKVVDFSLMSMAH